MEKTIRLPFDSINVLKKNGKVVIAFLHQGNIVTYHEEPIEGLDNRRVINLIGVNGSIDILLSD